MKKITFRHLLCLIGLLLAVPLLAFVALALTRPVTVSGIGYGVGLSLLVIGSIVAPRVYRYYAPLTGGVIVVLLVAGMRFVLVHNPNAGLNVISLPGGKETSWVNSLIDEQDSLVFGETFFHWIGGDSDTEHAGLALAFKNVYSDMRKEGTFSSPIASTYLSLQQPKHFDAVIVEPETTPEFGVIFLHGYMGNVTAQCWVIAQAVKKHGGVTVCPSTKWTGEWWLPEGQLILQASFRYLREQGIQTIYLGGFSNGGFSIGRLASQLAVEQGLSGLILIDGFMNGEGVRALGLPVLILEGTQDERVPVNVARQFAEEVGDLGTYVEVNSDHFLIIKEPGPVQNTIAGWLGTVLKP